MRDGRKIARHALLLWSSCLIATTSSSGQWKTESFSQDPGWVGFRNRLLPEERREVMQDFGYRSTNFAGGETAGEIGGIVQRSPTPAYYAVSIPPRSLDQPLQASGTLAVRRADGSSGVMVGWFKAPPSSWRTPSSLAFRIDGNGDKFWMFYEYGTQSYLTGGGGAFKGPQYQTTSTKPFSADGKAHRWSLDYDPQGAGGRGLLSFTIDDRSYELPLADGHRQDNAIFDHFGIWNVQTPGDRAEIYLDDLVIDTARYNFDQNPKWIAAGTPAHFPERIVRPFHDFGYSATNFAGGEKGEIGGIIFRDEEPSYYAARIEPLTLDQELVASGRLSVRMAASDSGVYLGWFDSQTKENNDLPEHQARQRNYLGVLIEGPSRVGHYFRPGYSCADGSGVNAGETTAGGVTWPVLKPDSAVHRWSMHYFPKSAEESGRIDLTLDGVTHSFAVNATSPAIFDRFGLFNMQAGGHGVEIYLDDLRYTAGRTTP